jgi:hypothetical protein
MILVFIYIQTLYEDGNKLENVDATIPWNQ